MRSKSEQIEHILSGDTGRWAASQLEPGEDLADFWYADFVSVTPDEVVDHVLAHGFDPRAVWTPRDPTRQKDNRLVVEPRGDRWVVCFTERGSDDDLGVHDSEEAAVRDAVVRLFHAAWTALNGRYWRRHHPEVPRMPAFGEPWNA